MSGTLYVAEHIFYCLLAALLLGGLLSWLLNRGRASNLETEWTRKLGLATDEKNQLAGQLRTSNDAVTEWKAKYGALDGQFDTVQAELAEVTGKVPALEAAVAGWVAKSVTWDSDKAKFQTDLTTCADARSQLDAEVSAWAAKGKAWDAERAAFEAEWNKKLAAANDEKAAIQASLKALQGDHGTLKSNFANLQGKIGPLEGAVVGWVAKSQTWDSDRNRLMAELHSATGLVGRRDAEIKDLQARLAGAQTQLGTAQGQLATTRSQLEKALSDDKADDAAYEKTIADLRLKLSALDREKARHEASENDLTARVHSLQAQLQKAIADDKADDAAYEKTIADLRTKVAAADGEHLRLAARFKDSETQLHDWRSRFASLEGEHGKVRHHLTEVSARIAPLEAAVAGWVAKSAAWDSDKGKLQLGLKNAGDARLKMESEVHDLTARLSSTDAQLKQAVASDRAGDAAYEKTIADLRTKLSDAGSEHTRLAARFKDSETQLHDWRARFASLEGEHGKVRHHLTEVSAKIGPLEAAVAGWVAKSAAWDSDRVKMESDYRGVSQARQRLEAQLNDWTAQARTWEARESDLNTRLRSTDAQLHKVIADGKAAAAAQEHTIGDLRGRVTAVENEWKSRYAALATEHGQCATRYAALETKLAAAPLAMAAAAAASSSPARASGSRKGTGGDIENIEGIGPVYGGKLRKIDIYWIRELLEAGKTPQGREQIAASTGIDPRLVLKWVNHADLLRIAGVTPNWAELMEASGVDTVKELQHRVAEHLQKKMEETNPTNGRGRYAPTVPDLETVQKWVEQAKKLEPKLTY